MKRLLRLFALGALLSYPALAQQTGSIIGKVTSPDGAAMPGVTVQANSDVLPRGQVTTTGEEGGYRFPALPPGRYTLSYTLEGMATETREVVVRLDVQITANVAMAPDAIEEAIQVIGETVLVDPGSAEVKTSIGNEVIEALPVGQEYRDLQKLIPGVQYSESTTRGPSAGGSGQDNVYLFDGVNVSLPLFGVLSTEPSSHDIDQVSIIKGGAKAIDFNRAAGFTINSVSKSGTNDFHGSASYQLQPDSFTSKSDDPNSFADETKDWATVNLGGPIIRDSLFFYASYYRPTISRDNGSNVYGSIPDFKSTRDEFFGRLSFQPTASLLIHGSYRDSSREDEHTSISSFEAPTAGVGSQADLKIAILEGSWTLGDSGLLSFKYTDFENKGGSIPDTLFAFQPAGDGSVPLNIADLASQGRVAIPIPRDGQPAFNSFIAPYINQYGFLENGVPTGGGVVGGASQVDRADYYRESYQIGYDWLFGTNVSHELHVGYQRYKDEEDFDRRSNGWGNITIPGGTVTSSGQPVYFQARLYQTGVTGLGTTIPNIHSEFESQSFEVNDTIRWNDWTFNVGVVVSNDELFGQGLRKGGSNPSGFELCLTCKYKMYEVKWEDQIQPRLGVIWSYQPEGTIYANWARYNPAASSLPRAASWARNLAAIRTANFDANGDLIDFQVLASSSGKFFQEGLDPRTTDEYLIGTSRELSRNVSARLTARYRYSYNFWEDTNNNARLFANAPDSVPHELYIPNLSELQQGIGGSSYVIAELDNAFTKYYEVAAEVEWRTSKSFVRGSYVWSHYYGNFDQDNTSGDYIDNDFAAFIGSSNIADGPGRQLWDFKYGNLHGDRRHQLKVYGYYMLPWNASAGAFAIYQSGQPWETWDVEVYRSMTSSTSNTIRFAEPAGTNRSPSHYQIDLNYTQDFDIGPIKLQLRGDVFNVLDKQTGYAYQPVISSANYGKPTEYFDPRRFQLAVRVLF